jgi:hypothetical protein
MIYVRMAKGDYRMGQCAEQVFSNCTIAKFVCLMAKAQAAGINIQGNSGTATQDGITISWTFDPAGETLSIQCTSAPFYLSCGTINQNIHDLVDSCP